MQLDPSDEKQCCKVTRIRKTRRYSRGKWMDFGRGKKGMNRKALSMSLWLVHFRCIYDSVTRWPLSYPLKFIVCYGSNKCLGCEYCVLYTVWWGTVLSVAASNVGLSCAYRKHLHEHSAYRYLPQVKYSSRELRRHRMLQLT